MSLVFECTFCPAFYPQFKNLVEHYEIQHGREGNQPRQPPVAVQAPSPSPAVKSKQPQQQPLKEGKKSQCPTDGAGYGSADSGCQQATDCLNGEPSCCQNCPFPECVYIKPGGIKKAIKKKRNEEILQQFKKGQSVLALAEAFGVCRSTVQDVVKNG